MSESKKQKRKVDFSNLEAQNRITNENQDIIHKAKHVKITQSIEEEDKQSADIIAAAFSKKALLEKDKEKERDGKDEGNNPFTKGEMEKSLSEALPNVSLNDKQEDSLNQERVITGPESLIDGDVVVDGSVGQIDAKMINNELYVVYTDQEGHEHYCKFNAFKEAIGSISQLSQDKV